MIDKDVTVIPAVLDNDFDITFDWNDPSATSQGGYTISFGPYEMNSPPPQKDLFRHYITSQWIHGYHLADEDPQYQCEAWIKSQPHLSEAWSEKKIEIVENGDDGIDYYYIGSNEDFLWWKIRWSEMLNV